MGRKLATLVSKNTGNIGDSRAPTGLNFTFSTSKSDQRIYVLYTILCALGKPQEKFFF